MSNGLAVHSINDDFCLPKVSGHTTSDTIGQVELVIVVLKIVANNCLYNLIKQLVAADTNILILQTGLGNEELLAELFGSGRIVWGVAFLCSNRSNPGHFHHLAAGRMFIGEDQKLGTYEAGTDSG